MLTLLLSIYQDIVNYLSSHLIVVALILLAMVACLVGLIKRIFR